MSDLDDLQEFLFFLNDDLVIVIEIEMPLLFLKPGSSEPGLLSRLR